jgi:hypothetical protein
MRAQYSAYSKRRQGILFPPTIRRPLRETNGSILSLRPSPLICDFKSPINTWTNGFYMPAVRSAWNCAQFSLTARAQSQRGKSTSCNVWVPRISPRNWRFAGPPLSSRRFYLLPGPSVWVWSGASPAGTAPRNLAPLCAAVGGGSR